MGDSDAPDRPVGSHLVERTSDRFDRLSPISEHPAKALKRIAACAILASPSCSGGNILTPGDSGALPPLVKLEACVAHLAQAGDDRTLICFVEAWSAHGDPSREALLAQARSFIRLGLYDRAWGRLQALQSSDPDVAILTGRMFIARGWNIKARKAVEKALQAHPNNAILIELFDQASEPPTEPDITDADPSEVPAAIAAARHYMATGSLVKARAILERLCKAQPANTLVSNMLWALGGEFGLDDTTFRDLVQRHGSVLQSLPDLPEDPDHTETAHIEDVIPADESGAFPALFRNMEPQTEYYGAMNADDEVTHVSAMAGLTEMQQAPAAGDTDPGEFMPSGEVTQIQMVVRKDGAIEEETTAGKSSSVFDLATLPPTHLSDLDLGPEQEDADVIVHTRREDDTEDDEAVTQVGKVELESEEPPITSRQLTDEAATWATPPKKPDPPPPPAESKKSSQPPAPERKRRRPRPAVKSNWPWYAAAMVGVLLVSGGLIVLAVLIQLAASFF